MYKFERNGMHLHLLLMFTIGAGAIHWPCNIGHCDYENNSEVGDCTEESDLDYVSMEEGNPRRQLW